MKHAFLKDDTVALFYDGFESQAIDAPFGSLRSDIRGFTRRTYRTIRRKQLYTGYYTAFLNLKRSLESQGIKVRVNDFAYARRNPGQPIGISGYPSVFDKVRLPNPAVFGPGFVPPPTEVERIMAQCNIRVVTLPSEWPCTMWRPLLGDAVQPMFVSIDVDDWPDLSAHTKDLDVIVYDKMRWAREDRVNDLLTPLLKHLEAKGLSYLVLRYGDHHLAQFRQALSRGRSMVFICEHETQGLAYQEALSSNVPVLAWDEGVLMDPHQKKHANDQTLVSSVPYFDERCGHVFKRAEMKSRFDDFFGALDGFEPRSYVLDSLNFRAGAERYLHLLQMAVSQ